MSKKLLASILITSTIGLAVAQNNALVINGAAVVLNGGSVSTPIYLVVDQSNTAGITYSGAGRIVSESQYNFVKWNCATGTGSYIVPFGATISANVYSLPFTFNKTSAGSANLTVSTWHTDNQNMPHPGVSNVAAVCCMIGNGDSVTSAIDRFWDIRTSATATASLTFKYAGVENTTAVPGDPFKAQHWNGTSWDAAVGPGQAGVTGLTVGTVGPVTGQSTFSPWVLTNSNNILPVQLIDFTLNCSNKHVQVKWATATEINSDYFTVERSADGLNYQVVATMPAAGNSNLPVSYSWTDTDPLKALAHYRLKQTDSDGTTQTFKSQTIECGGSGGTVVIGSNLNDGDVWVNIGGYENKNASFEIFDLLGQRVFLKSFSSMPAQFSFSTNLRDRVAPGIYMVKVITPGGVAAQKVLMLK